MATSLDSFLNFAIPALIIIIIVGWLYIKLIKPFVVPFIKDVIHPKSEEKEKEERTESVKTIEYE